MLDETIPPSITENEPAAPVANGNESRRKRIICGFCECELAPDGGVLRVSERQKTLLGLEEKNILLRDENSTLKEEIAHAQPSSERPVETPPKRKGFLSV